MNLNPMVPPARSSWLWNTIVAILTPLASLKLTVVLFLMAIFIVFAGTLAQTEKDIWQVIHDYFRMDLGSFSAAFSSALAWIDFRIFFPRSFFPSMDPIPWGYGFWFPSGWLIGFVLFLNLTAAHLIRFRIQGSGKSLIAGLVVLVVGVLLAIAVVAAGSQQTATQLQLFTDWPSLRILWLLTQCTVVSVVLLVGSAVDFPQAGGHRRAARRRRTHDVRRTRGRHLRRRRPDADRGGSDGQLRDGHTQDRTGDRRHIRSHGRTMWS